jgi:hypothetical protein
MLTVPSPDEPPVCYSTAVNALVLQLCVCRTLLQYSLTAARFGVQNLTSLVCGCINVIADYPQQKLVLGASHMK